MCNADVAQTCGDGQTICFEVIVVGWLNAASRHRCNQTSVTLSDPSDRLCAAGQTRLVLHALIKRRRFQLQTTPAL